MPQPPPDESPGQSGKEQFVVSPDEPAVLVALVLLVGLVVAGLPVAPAEVVPAESVPFVVDADVVALVE